MRKFYSISSTPYCSFLDQYVKVVYAEKLEEAHVYLVKYEDEEDIYHEKIVEHHKYGKPVLFDSKEEYEQFKAKIIENRKNHLLVDDNWIEFLYSEYCSNYSEQTYEIDREAIRQIIKEKLGIDV